MKIKVIEDKKRRLVFDIDADHGFCNALKKELWNDKEVALASYSIAHPLVGRPRMVVETTRARLPRAALKSAAERLKKQAEGFKKELKKVK